MSILITLFAVWPVVAVIVGVVFGRAIAQADRREADMRRHPCVAGDFEEHTAQALAISDFDRWEKEQR